MGLTMTDSARTMNGPGHRLRKSTSQSNASDDSTFTTSNVRDSTNNIWKQSISPIARGTKQLMSLSPELAKHIIDKASPNIKSGRTKHLKKKRATLESELCGDGNEHEHEEVAVKRMESADGIKTRIAADNNAHADTGCIIAITQRSFTTDEEESLDACASPGSPRLPTASRRPRTSSMQTKHYQYKNTLTNILAEKKASHITINSESTTQTQTQIQTFHQPLELFEDTKTLSLSQSLNDVAPISFSETSEMNKFEGGVSDTFSTHSHMRLHAQQQKASDIGMDQGGGRPFVTESVDSSELSTLSLDSLNQPRRKRSIKTQDNTEALIYECSDDEDDRNMRELIKNHMAANGYSTECLGNNWGSGQSSQAGSREMSRTPSLKVTDVDAENVMKATNQPEHRNESLHKRVLNKHIEDLQVHADVCGIAVLGIDTRGRSNSAVFIAGGKDMSSMPTRRRADSVGVKRRNASHAAVSGFTKNIIGGLTSSNFCLNENVEQGDERSGLCDKEAAFISEIMAQKGISFDEARFELTKRRMRENGIDPETGLPLDERAVHSLSDHSFDNLHKHTISSNTVDKSEDEVSIKTNRRGSNTGSMYRKATKNWTSWWSATPVSHDGLA
ncbi:hypothetical protein SARC_00147 [Sphaeroforma arctica JP610]|uniref:Uncharacterized protein n=1 Tax=Sphaeroforma arctica JP610 TaxID=667725 RepID=A0A0L0GFD2_9EUKA|nr:hypothetical protein SARC_00147 [Sphaeroforma arctica JP610]KNC87775.1 hypothetical protein SARC_00147 [Sphaeroforma arctica JP610]|eukprot:XP_014161677.1 hypothetical protein SARC_00147 [Sphaeroforma arctica JP610]